MLQHLSNSEILKIIPKLNKNCKYLALTEHLPNFITFSHNLDKPTGHNIHLKSGSEVTFTPCCERSDILCEIPEYGDIILTTVHKLQD